MKPPVIARSGSEIDMEGLQLVRFAKAYEDIADALDNGILGEQAAGGQAVSDWILDRGPPLSKTLQDAMRSAIQENIRPKRRTRGLRPPDGPLSAADGGIRGRSFMVKPFWRSKTFWGVVIAAGIIVAQWAQGTTWIPVGYQGAIGTAITLLLRFVSDQGITIPGVTDKS